MIRFGLITEGFTDQAVVGNIVTGVHDPETISLRQIKPIRDITQRSTVDSFSNWGLVLEFIASPNFSEVFPFVDFVVIHIDTDECDHQNFGVSKSDDSGNRLNPTQLVEKATKRPHSIPWAPPWVASAFLRSRWLSGSCRRFIARR